MLSYFERIRTLERSAKPLTSVDFVLMASFSLAAVSYFTTHSLVGLKL